MPMRLSNFFRGSIVGLVVGAGWFVSAPSAEAQTVFCPTSSLGQSGFVLSDGACTNGRTGSFSGAALASQALSSLSQTATQETTRASVTAITDRREQEEQRCAEGFTRVEGTCRPVQPPVPEAASAASSTISPSERIATGKAKKVERAAISREEAGVPSAKKIVAYDRPTQEAVPLALEPVARFGAWGHVYGDYEKRNATSPASVLCCIISGITTPLPLSVNVQSRTGTVGFQTGLDFTSRGMLSASDGLITGMLVGYLASDMTLNSNVLSSDFAQARNSYSRLTANLSGPTLGVYATYFDKAFSADFLYKADILRLDETFQDSLAFCACFEPGTSSIVPFSGTGSVSLVNSTFAGNLNYRFALSPTLWVEPTVGAQYTLTTYGANAHVLGLENGSLVRVQGGARFGLPIWLNVDTLMTTTLAGLAYSDVLVSGGFIPGAGFAGNNILASADQGQVRGRGVVAVNVDYGNGVSSFIQGEARGGQGLFGAGGRAGVRVVW
jgi:hypothetical protein